MAGIPLTAVNGGINRLRIKGAALSDSLYDLLNGYVTKAKTVVGRPGTRRLAELPEATRGLCSFNGKLHTFCHTAVEVPEGYVLHIITHPDDPDLPLVDVHFEEPFMGYLYVVAEFDVGSNDYEPIHHYWLQTGEPWEAEKIYKIGDIVEPSTPTGLSYQATRLTPPAPVWAPSVARAVSDVVEPTEYNGFQFTVVATEGDHPSSGSREPAWVTEPGARTVEDTEIGSSSASTEGELPDVNRTPAQSVRDRYGAL